MFKHKYITLRIGVDLCMAHQVIFLSLYLVQLQPVENLKNSILHIRYYQDTLKFDWFIKLVYPNIIFLGAVWLASGCGWLSWSWTWACILSPEPKMLVGSGDLLSTFTLAPWIWVKDAKNKGICLLKMIQFFILIRSCCQNVDIIRLPVCKVPNFLDE